MLKNRIKELVEQDLQSTIYQFATDTGIARSTAYDFANKPEKIPTAATLGKICKTYKIPVEQVIYYDFAEDTD